MKYRELIEKLDDDVLYTPATIAGFAESEGMLAIYAEMDEMELHNPRHRRLMKTRIRIALGRFSNNKRFPDEGDGMVTIKGQAPTPGWFGSRWKDALQD